MNEKIRFAIIFIVSAIVMKVVGEVIHELLGHGTFILLFGGEISGVHISLLWPYELSYISWIPPQGGFSASELPWVHGGGILVCLIVSFTLQVLLFFRLLKDWRLTTPLFWLAFWTFLNPAGYLLMGGIDPFGDVQELISDGVLSQGSSLAIGIVLFFIAFFVLSRVLTDLLIDRNIIKDVKTLRIALILFWLLLPLLTGMALAGLGILGKGLLSLAISFLPSVLAYFLPLLPWMRSPEETDAVEAQKDSYE